MLLLAHHQGGNEMQAFLGQIGLFPYEFAPQPWVFCEGQLLAINQNVALFSVLGTQFGGDGKATFALPNLKGKEPLPGLRYCISMEGVYPQRG